MGRRESRDEWARSLAHIVCDTGGQWVGWPGAGLPHGQAVPRAEGGGHGATARLGGDQVCPVYLDKAQIDHMYQHCRQVSK